MKSACFLFMFLIFNASASSISFSSQNVNIPNKAPFLASVWCRAKNDAGANAQVSMALKEVSNGKNEYRELGYTKVLTSEWSRISAWISPAKEGTERSDIILNIKGGAEIELKDAKFAEVPETMPPFDTGFIRVEGAKLFNDKGNIIFRGVNLSAYCDEEKDDCVSTLGRCCEEDYKEIANLGFNAVRLACWQKALVEPGGLDWLRLQLSFARKYGLYIVLDMHAPSGGYQGPNYNGKFWHEEKGAKFREELLKFWSDTAKMFKDEPVIAAYDILNEPKPKTNSQWHEYVKLLVSKIRGQGDRHAIIVETCMLSDDDWPELEDKGIIYDTHFYTPWEFVSQTEKKPFGKYNSKVKLWGDMIFLDKKFIASELDTYLSRCAKRNVPVQVGEYGTGLYTDKPEIGGLEWLKDLVSIFDEHGISRFYWSWDIYSFGIHNGWFRRDPGVFRKEVAKIAGGN